MYPNQKLQSASVEEKLQLLQNEWPKFQANYKQSLSSFKSLHEIVYELREIYKIPSKEIAARIKVAPSRVDNIVSAMRKKYKKGGAL